MKLEDFKKKTGRFRFYDHDKIQKQGYATIKDVIIDTVIHPEDNEYRVENDYTNEVIEFNSLEELLMYRPRNGLTIKQLIERETGNITYHINMIIE